MQPQTQTGIVWKISVAIVFLLAFVLYKTNDYFRQEKWQLAKNQLRSQVINTKTSVSAQLGSLKKILSSYEYGLNEAQINWVSLDPFFAIASAQMSGPKNAPSYKIQKVIGRSGSGAERWTPQFLESALSNRVVSAEQPIGVQLFHDRAGQTYLSLRFNQAQNKALIVVGRADYFQKFFDVARGGRSTVMLHTTENMIAGHSEADYVGSVFEDQKVSWKKFLVEREDIAGTNLVLLNFVSRAVLAKGLAVPWSIVGLIVGFGLLLIGLLIYTTQPLEKRIEKYKKQERDDVYQKTLAESTALVTAQAAKQDLAAEAMKAPLKPTGAAVFEEPAVEEDVQPPVVAEAPKTATDIVKAKIDQALEEMSRPENLSLKNKVNRVFQNEEVAKVDVDSEPIEEFQMMTPAAKPTEPVIVSPSAGSVVLDDAGYEPPSEEFTINKIMTPVGLSETEIAKATETTPSSLDKVSAFEENASPASIRENFLKQLSEEKFPSMLSEDKSDEKFSLDLEQTKTHVPLSKEEFSFEKADELVDFDVDKALSIDDIDVAKVEARMQPKNVNTEGSLFGLSKPQINLKKKSYQVDSIQVAIRRPEKS